MLGADVLRFALRRTAQALPLILGVATLMFLLIHLAPGDAADAMVGEYPVSPEYMASVRERYGLDKSLPEQFIAYLGQLARGNLGTSFANSSSVLNIILDRVGNTLILAATGLIIAAIIGVALGVWAGVTRKRWLDNLITGSGIGAFSIPAFWLGQLLLMTFALAWGVLPVSGMTNARASYTGSAYLGDLLLHLILPATALALREIGTTSRIVRTSVKETLGLNHIWTAQAKGLSRWRIIRKHVIRNALLPGVTVIGYSFGYLLAGSVLVETVFVWPGMGRLLYESVLRRDNALVIGIVLFIAATVLVVNLVTDIIYGVIDPRIRLTAPKGSR